MGNIKEKIKKLTILYMAFFAISALFYFVAGEQIQIKRTISAEIKPDGIVGELIDGFSVEQEFVGTQNQLEQIKLMFSNYMRDNAGTVSLQLKDKDSGEVLQQTELNAAEIGHDMLFTWTLEPMVNGVLDKTLVLSIKADSLQGQGVTVYCNSAQQETGSVLYQNGTEVPGMIAFQTVYASRYLFGQYYWVFIIVAAILIAIYYWYSCYSAARGKYTMLVVLQGVWEKYGFLIKQLVSRDFKTKYKRSVLGYLWSFLNPLMTMMVQYIVFSQLFKSDIENFPIYLLSGIVLFGFFTESVGQGLSAILANASLITKVYVPKYIYPVTKVVSSSINLFISLIPLMLVVLLTGQKITKAIILLPFPLICLLIFCIGMSFMLSTAEVFFRDTQYLWGVVTLAWTYATPLFYPENIIPDRFRFIQTYNPMYHFIGFTRTLLIEGVSPAPEEYLYCLLFAFGTLVIGAAIFKKFQNRFVLYI
ncbi:MAG: ABC transporter permease [Lachnospirales bacterium]